MFPNLPTNRKLLACLDFRQIVPSFVSLRHALRSGTGSIRDERDSRFRNLVSRCRSLVEISSKKKVAEGDACLTNGNNLWAGTSAKKLVALHLAVPRRLGRQ